MRPQHAARGVGVGVRTVRGISSAVEVSLTPRYSASYVKCCGCGGDATHKAIRSDGQGGERNVCLGARCRDKAKTELLATVRRTRPPEPFVPVG